MHSGLLTRVLVIVLAALAGACGGDTDTPDRAAAAIAARIAAADTPGADEQLREAIRRWPDDSRLRELQGDLDLERGYGTRAQAAYEKALRGAPQDRALQVKLARALLVQNRLREVLLLAKPAAGDSDEVRAGFRLLRLEAELAGGTTDFNQTRLIAESLWRSTADAQTPRMAEIARRLADLAPRFAPVEAGRQHAQCRPPAEPAPTAETDVAAGTVVRVGPGEKLRTPGAAAAVATDGAVVDIAVGDYVEGEVTWTQDNLTLRGLNGRPRMHPAASASRATWRLQGRRTLVENIEFAGAAGSGPGIRLEAGDLTVRGSIFRGSGIVAGDDAPESEILVSGSQFAGDTAPAGPSIDVGRIARLTVEFSHVHGERSGRHLRSRARVTAINYNRIGDAGGVVPGALIELPEGGAVEILGNELARGSASGGADFVVFGTPGRAVLAGSRLSVLGNTFYNQAEGRTAVRVRGEAAAVVANNALAGVPMAVVAGKVLAGGNVEMREGLVNPRAGDFRLRPGSPAIDAAVDATALAAQAPVVEFEYLHPISGVARPTVWARDSGAHEFCGSAAAGVLIPDVP